MQQKIWQIKEPVSAELLNQFPELHPLLVQFLANRNLTSQVEVEKFLNPDYETTTHSPFLFRDMKRSVERIFLAIDKKEKITIHGDYDSDGVNGSSLLFGTMKDLGANVDVYLPHREKEGYGVNPNTVRFLKEQGTTLIITVDCGSTNNEPLELAEELGINVIITDHHHVPENPPKVFALINPQNHNDTYPYGLICGTAVAFKLAQALFLTDQEKSSPILASGYDKWLLDCVAIATITDMMPLLDENRTFVKYGLIVLNKTRRVGLKMLMEHAGVWSTGKKDVSTTDIGFVIGPRINAAGRMDHANAAFKLMVATSEDECAPYIENIETNNSDRKILTEKIVAEVMEQATDIDDKFILVAYGQGWPVGLAGLVASKVMDKVSRPVIIMTKLEDRIAASGRSVPGFNMAEALEKIKDYFATSGGHAMACGFSLKEGVDPMMIKAEFEKLAQEALDGKDLRPLINIDADLAAENVRWDVVDIMNQLSPFGKDNPEPLFLTKNLEVVDVRKLGEKEQHLKLKLQDRKLLKSFSAIGFSITKKYPEIKIGSTIDLVYKLDVNEWNGNKELQLKIEDINIIE